MTTTPDADAAQYLGEPTRYFFDGSDSQFDYWTRKQALAAVQRALKAQAQPAAPAMPWGRSDLMALAAVRYCIGRMSYIVGDCCDWLQAVWPHLSDSIKATIRRDIEEAIARDDASRAQRTEHHPLGMDMDRVRWLEVRKLWAPETPQ